MGHFQSRGKNHIELTKEERKSSSFPVACLSQRQAIQFQRVQWI
jgi:hypothetical protein